MCLCLSSFPPLTARQSEVRHLGDVAGPVVHEDDVGELEVAEDHPVVVAVLRAGDDVRQAAGRNGKRGVRRQEGQEARRQLDGGDEPNRRSLTRRYTTCQVALVQTGDTW